MLPAAVRAAPALLSSAAAAGGAVRLSAQGSVVKRQGSQLPTPMPTPTPQKRSASASGSGGSDRPVYLVFGASGGIGNALVERLSRGAAGGGNGGVGGGGATVVLAGRDERKLQATAEERGGGGGGGDSAVLLCDALDPKQVEDVVSGVLSKYGRLDGVANCVGNVVAGAASTVSLEHFKQTLDVNLVTAFNVTKAATKALLNQPGGGSLVLVSAAVAETGVPHFEAMSAAKAGVEGLARAAAASYADRGVRVNCVAPGLTRTRQTEQFTEGSPAVRDASRSMVPARRFASPHDIAAALAFFLSPDSGFVTGQVLAVDGGLSTLHPRPTDAQQGQQP